MILIRALNNDIAPHHVSDPDERNEIGDCLSRLCGVISR